MDQTHARGVERRAYLQKVAALMKARVGNDPGVRGLQLFRDRIIARPNDLRRRLLGDNAMRVRELDAAARRCLDSLGVSPDLLGPLGELRYEPTHSRLVAHFLNPLVEPALAPPLLGALFSQVDVPVGDPSVLATAKVRGERLLPAGRLDVSIELEDHLVFVEMKVDASEGDQQLARYAEALELLRGTRRGTLVYLTLDEEDGTDEKVPHVHLSFRQLLLAWLPFAGAGSGPEQYLARYLKSVALVVGAAGMGPFEAWSLGQQRRAIALVEELEES